jgi:hypothetical protein
MSVLPIERLDVIPDRLGEPVAGEPVCRRVCCWILGVALCDALQADCSRALQRDGQPICLWMATANGVETLPLDVPAQTNVEHNADPVQYEVLAEIEHQVVRRAPRVAGRAGKAIRGGDDAAKSI